MAIILRDLYAEALEIGKKRITNPEDPNQTPARKEVQEAVNKNLGRVVSSVVQRVSTTKKPLQYGSTASV